MLLVTIEDLVAGLARDAELPAHTAHHLAVQKTRHKRQAFLHDRTLFPRHSTPPARHVWLEVSPMSPERSVTHVSGRSPGITTRRSASIWVTGEHPRGATRGPGRCLGGQQV